MSGIEIVGLAAAVLQIAELGAKLSVKLFTFTRKIQNSNKSIDALSRDIAATGAVLSQLGATLSDDTTVKVCSQQAVDAAKTLVDDTTSVFESLEKIVERDEKSNHLFSKPVPFKQKFKYPFLEPQIEQLQANLERLKSSLLVILNVLIFAEQLRNQESLPILKDQRELIKILVTEKDENERRYQVLLTAITDNSNIESQRSINDSGSLTQHSDSATILLTKDPFPEHVSDSGSNYRDAPPTTHSDESVRGLKRSALIRSDQPGFENFKLRIHYHSNLVQSLLSIIKGYPHDIDYATRDRLHTGILRLHWKEWTTHRQIYGRSDFLRLLEDHKDLIRYWSDRTFLEDDAYSRGLDLREKQKYPGRYDLFERFSDRSQSRSRRKARRAHSRRDRSPSLESMDIEPSNRGSRSDTHDETSYMPPEVAARLARLVSQEESHETEERKEQTRPEVAKRLARLKLSPDSAQTKEPEPWVNQYRSETSSLDPVIQERLKRLKMIEEKKRLGVMEEKKKLAAMEAMEMSRSREEHDFESRIKERFMRAGYSPEYIEDILDEKTNSPSNTKHDQNSMTIDASRPTYIRVQLHHVSPQTLDFYKLPWEYDKNNDNYIFIKEYISHELQQELFAHTRENRVLTEGYTKETVTTLKPSVTKDSSETYLVQRKTKDAALDDVDKLILGLTNLEESELRTIEEKRSKWMFT